MSFEVIIALGEELELMDNLRDYFLDFRRPKKLFGEACGKTFCRFRKGGIPVHNQVTNLKTILFTTLVVKFRLFPRTGTYKILHQILVSANSFDSV